MEELAENKESKVKSTMVVLTPDGTPVEYHWNAANKLIRTSIQGGPPVQPSVELPSIQPPDPGENGNNEEENASNNSDGSSQVN